MALSEEAKEARRAYKREWYRRNPEKAKAAQERHWQKVAERLASQKTDEPETEV